MLFRSADEIGPLAAGSAAGVVDAADDCERRPTLDHVNAGQRPASQQAVGGRMTEGAGDVPHRRTGPRYDAGGEWPVERQDRRTQRFALSAAGPQQFIQANGITTRQTGYVFEVKGGEILFQFHQKRLQLPRNFKNHFSRFVIDFKHEMKYAVKIRFGSGRISMGCLFSLCAMSFRSW